MPRAHTYDVSVTWTGNLGSGTSGTRAYRPDHSAGSAGLPLIAASSDPSYGGDPGRWNPEELLVASLSQCHMLSFLSLCAREGLAVTDYRDHAAGAMIETPDGGGHFVEVVLRPQVRFASPQQAERAAELHERAHHLCFIASSVSFPVRCEPSEAGSAEL